MGNFIRRLVGAILFIGLLSYLTNCEQDDYLEDTGEISLSVSNESQDINSMTLFIKRLRIKTANAGWIDFNDYNTVITLNPSENNHKVHQFLTHAIIPARIYTQVELELDPSKSYTEDINNHRHFLRMEDVNNRVKIRGGFKIPEDRKMDLLINLDLKRDATDTFELSRVARLSVLESIPAKI